MELEDLLFVLVGVSGSACFDVLGRVSELSSEDADLPILWDHWLLNPWFNSARLT